MYAAINTGANRTVKAKCIAVSKITPHIFNTIMKTFFCILMHRFPALSFHGSLGVIQRDNNRQALQQKLQRNT